MKSISQVIIITILAVSLAHCSRNEFTPDDVDNSCENSANITITSTKVCGWFPNYDSLAIDGKSLRYYNYCLKDKPAKEYPITCDEWNDLLSKLDIEKFKKITINTCNLCVDGCDVSISIKTESQYHRITFGPDYNQTPPEIADLVADIEKLRMDAQVKACGK